MRTLPFALLRAASRTPHVPNPSTIPYILTRTHTPYRTAKFNVPLSFYATDTKKPSLVFDSVSNKDRQDTPQISSENDDKSTEEQKHSVQKSEDNDDWCGFNGDFNAVTEDGTPTWLASYQSKLDSKPDQGSEYEQSEDEGEEKFDLYEDFEDDYENDPFGELQKKMESDRTSETESDQMKQTESDLKNQTELDQMNQTESDLKSETESDKMSDALPNDTSETESEISEPTQEILSASSDDESETPQTKVRVCEIDEFGRSYGTGRRKTSTARVWIKKAKTPYQGYVKINKKDLVDYFTRDAYRMEVLSPFVVIDQIGQFDVICNVAGGGMSGQAGAIRHGISRALQNFDPQHRTLLKKEGFLTRDPRMVERKKPGQPKARKKFQWVKR